MRALGFLRLTGFLLAPACFAPLGGVHGTDDKDDRMPRGVPTDREDYDWREFCAQRRSEALEGNRHVLLPDAVRWSCADVRGVDTVGQDDRGQEYCEYFAVVNVPPATTRASVWRPEVRGHRSTELGIEFNDHQIAQLEDDSARVVGQCVFTSWHQDVPGPVPNCRRGQECPEVLGVRVDEDLFRMTATVNSNNAARELIRDCASLDPTIYLTGNAEDLQDPLHDAFTRGCSIANLKYTTAWRRSDSAVCVASMRLAECGCGMKSRADLIESIIPAQPATAEDGPVTLRGFPLGSWGGMSEGDLPAGCHTVDTGESVRTIVACDLTSGEVLESAADPKELCRTKYGADVVVYAPLPKDDIACAPPEGGPYANTCASESPWVVDRRSVPPPVGE